MTDASGNRHRAGLTDTTSGAHALTSDVLVWRSAIGTAATTGSADVRAYVSMYFMEAGIVRRAMTAVTSLAGALGLQVNEAVMIQDSNKLALHLLPCDVFARIALVGQEVAALEVEVARGLAAVAGPAALLDPRVEP